MKGTGLPFPFLSRGCALFVFSEWKIPFCPLFYLKLQSIVIKHIFLDYLYRVIPSRRISDDFVIDVEP